MDANKENSGGSKGDSKSEETDWNTIYKNFLKIIIGIKSLWKGISIGGGLILIGYLADILSVIESLKMGDILSDVISWIKYEIKFPSAITKISAFVILLCSVGYITLLIRRINIERKIANFFQVLLGICSLGYILIISGIFINRSVIEPGYMPSENVGIVYNKNNLGSDSLELNLTARFRILRDKFGSNLNLRYLPIGTEERGEEKIDYFISKEKVRYLVLSKDLNHNQINSIQDRNKII